MYVAARTATPRRRTKPRVRIASRMKVRINSAMRVSFLRRLGVIEGHVLRAILQCPLHRQDGQIELGESDFGIFDPLEQFGFPLAGFLDLWRRVPFANRVKHCAPSPKS